jgi:5'-nucleotidase (lipoprotein e(P4) family)
MKYTRLITAAFLLMLLFLSLQPARKASPAPAETSGDSLNLIAAEHKMMALLWVQSSAEYEALCLQTFAMARHSIEAQLALASGQKPGAVVFDIDETVLDNSPYEAAALREAFSYPYCWDTWCQQASARAVPGAVEFITFLQGKGITPIFITNRREHLREATKLNLEKVGVHGTPDKNLLLRSAENTKEPRRQTVSADFEILMLVGDNLADFDQTFDEGSPAQRKENVQLLRDSFGKRFIVLPNPLYGNWESAIYSGGEKGAFLQRQARLATVDACNCTVPPGK